MGFIRLSGDDHVNDEKKFHKDLENLLRDFIIQYVKKLPSDILTFSENYFQNLFKLNCSDRDIKDFHSNRSQISSSTYNPSQRMSVRRSIHRCTESSDKYVFEANENLEDGLDSDIEFEDILKSVSIFSTLNEEEMDIIMKKIKRKETHPGEVIIKQDDEGDYFYIVIKGIYEVYILKGKEQVNVKSYHGQGYFGEVALLYNCLRIATVVSRTNGILWCIDKKHFSEIVSVKAFEKRKFCFKILKKVEMFKEFSDFDLYNVADSVIRRTYHRNECIMAQGKEAEEMYVIESGEVLIMRKSNQNDKELLRLHCGDYFGELSLITNCPRKVSAYAVTEVEVMVISKDWFFRLFGHCLESLKATLSKYIYLHLFSED